MRGRRGLYPANGRLHQGRFRYRAPGEGPPMKTARRLGVGLLIMVLVAAIGLAAWEPLTATAPAPPPAHTYNVTLARDNFGVPHIFGKTDPMWRTASPM